jgi:ABC-2 type transport system ATP-binding protein
LIAVADDRPYDIVRDAVAELGLPLVRLQQRRGSLEDLFRDAPTDGAATTDGHGVATAQPEGARR